MILAKKGNVSFSKVNYREMAPRVGLDPFGMGDDMQTFAPRSYSNLLIQRASAGS